MALRLVRSAPFSDLLSSSSSSRRADTESTAEVFGRRLTPAYACTSTEALVRRPTVAFSSGGACGRARR